LESSVTAAPPTAVGSEPSLSILQRLAAVFARPARAWEGLETRAQWWFPLLVMMVASGASAALLHQRALVPMVVEQWEQEVQNGRMSAEQVDHMQKFFSSPAGLALTVGQIDPRYSAIVAFDPAGSTDISSLALHTPTMIHVADYSGNTSAIVTPLLPDGTEVPLPLPLPVLTFLPYGPNETRSDYPVPAPGSKYTFFDSLRSAAVDTMQVGIRAAIHIDWGRPEGGTFSTYGECAWVRFAARCGLAAGLGAGVTGAGVAAGASPADPPPTDGSAAAGAGSCAAAEEP